MPSIEQQPEALLREREAARLLRVCVSNLRSRRARRLPPEWIKLGARILYKRSTLCEFIEASVVRLDGEGITTADQGQRGAGGGEVSQVGSLEKAWAAASNNSGSPHLVPDKIMTDWS